ncbi:hypothetical protein N9D31_01085 [Oligoflexaceae bacterium]|nr:hypothetical protein [Oligoflexaceae bacterium]
MFKFVCVLISALCVSSCITSKSKSNTSKQVRLKPKAGEGRSEGTTAGVSQTSTNLPAKPSLEFISRMSVVNPPDIKAEDHTLITETLQKLTPDQIDRGFLATAALRLTLMKTHQSQQYEELDLFSGSKSPTSSESMAPLSSLAAEYRINILQELNENPTLQSAGIFAMALKAGAKESSEFKRSLASLVQQKISQWKSVSSDLSPFIKSTGESSKYVLESQNDVADIRLADLALVEAGRLAGLKKFQEAVTLAESISEKNPLFQNSREKIRMFSDQAVMDLRRKAALAFQNALPVTDRKIKLSYLTEAKSYLESALDKYPQSQKLDKIKENLDVITRDLNNLERNN